ncbi:hypothetical protein SUGI_0474290 [Cryptomeria japonica]|uniref:GRAS family protein RAD1-like n=1 Tax=Cryptomeria japonica TaxID=3369 RepID=UPI002408D63E|nr:GRAS family protein RAD1-like [Cryptomeria japonica]GLJ24802.1 hypothetical protein SUGI_0474290 [Cryptomeria japonica]
MAPVVMEPTCQNTLKRKGPETLLQLGCRYPHNDDIESGDDITPHGLSYAYKNSPPLGIYPSPDHTTSPPNDDTSVITQENNGTNSERYRRMNGPARQKRNASTPLVESEKNGTFPFLYGEETLKGKPEVEKFSPKKPQFRDHIWKYAQMYRAETCMTVDLEEAVGNNTPAGGGEIDPGEGVELVQRLFACAEAVACRDARQAAKIIHDLGYLVSPYGSSLQRVATCFIRGLAVRLAVLLNPNGCSSLPQAASPLSQVEEPSKGEKEEALRLVYEQCPYIPFGHFAANVAIMEAFEGEDFVHVVDLGMTSGLSCGLQWCHLIEKLVARRGGPPQLLRITGIGSSAATMAVIGAQIEAHAQAMDLALEFQPVEAALENVVASMLEIRDGEALAVNSVVELHCVVKESRGSLNAVLQAIHKLRPKVLTLVEQDASHNGPFFLGRFMEALYYYSAIFDSLDAILPRSSTQRVKMEQFYFGEEIKNIVSCEGPARVERHERVDQWRRRMSRAGFQSSPLKIITLAKAWLNQHFPCDGYTLTEEKGCLVLGWRGKPIIAASCWKC